MTADGSAIQALQAEASSTGATHPSNDKSLNSEMPSRTSSQSPLKRKSPMASPAKYLASGSTTTVNTSSPAKPPSRPWDKLFSMEYHS
ncbi:hypothetical protein PV10_02643 [Exophiala mesophila]|uniref:Uncharacterized protein n=1 Tax=Exophiala mesophila TaxID=212818 RepID=A0A0D2A7G1_EXOME|nr:uncharacterized protein PV10_02643 [Exophiala mesophila]KIV94923.1 hypothetical protein PV10_02643 [Exophiala mesophila]